MRKTTFVTLLLAGSAAAVPASAQQQLVTVDGSSTVFPISEAMAEEFQAATGTRVTVGLSGTGGGFKKFCRGETDVTGASRPIKKEEIELCAETGVEYIELPVAMDGLAVIVNPQNDWAECLSVADLKAMWEVPAQGKVTNWNQANPDFPDAPLRLFGAGTDSGTYDYFTLAINGTEHESRGDFTATEDDNITIQGVAGDVNALGFLGLAYLEENRDKVKAAAIRQDDGSCVAPTIETAGDGSYQPLARPLFMYISKAALDRPEVQAYADFLMDPEHGTTLVSEVGYVALPEKAFELGRAKVAARKTGSFFDGGAKIGVSIEELLASEN
ncbi:PstS family phosphate ABC transporter substrate-binding protein (plasmid) [Cereibacter azotoformans]|uniref:PstS family phosphate ABC transporter substrate-binding protein n=1 Tax=Cereibacter azotoformans TaxID=43057 RepID=UPI001EECEFE5|nr:PstS family phosphate ABC transporter substrate-binding protein [Cereibacter azotoformans]ULB12492.1 PstS family phosphate ABC transporter substrate-binding protein [Cereibacter azotoformans]